MTDPGVVAALGIEAVQWLSGGGESMTVRVSGRWGRRRPSLTGAPLLLIESGGRRHRFTAMPEPPSLSGAAPGTWRMSFTVPESVGQDPAGRTWLQLGASLVPLPREPDSGGPGGLAPAATAPPGPALILERRLRSAELEVQRAQARATTAEAATAGLASRIAELRHERNELSDEIDRREAAAWEQARSLRDARQRAHAEEMVRLELARERDDALGELVRVRLRLEQLEDELMQLRRRADEAEHLAAVARARPEAKRRYATGALAAEHAVAAAAAARPVALAAILPLPPRPPWSGDERGLVEARVRSAMRGQSSQLSATLEALRDELAELRAIAERERAARTEAQALSERLERELRDRASRSTRAYNALDELRGQIEAVRLAYAALERQAPEEGGAADRPSPSGAGRSVERGRLDAALLRLRESTPPRPDATDPAENARTLPGSEQLPVPGAGADRLKAEWRRIARLDPARAGLLLLELLPAQGLVHPGALAYDLLLGESSCLRVTVTEGGHTVVDPADAARPLEDVLFRLEGDPASIARLLIAGSLRRRLSRRRRLARVRRDKRGVDALRELLSVPLAVPDLIRVGVQPERVQRLLNRAQSD